MTMFCFFNGQFVEEDKVHVSINDRGFTIGDGVFDTQVAENGVLPDGALHFDRLQTHAFMIDIPITQDVAELQTIAHMLMVRNGITTGRWVVRTQITRGVALRGLAPTPDAHPTIVMRAMPVPVATKGPTRAIIAQTVRRNEHSPLSRVKSLNYGDNILALLEARDLGADDAMLLNTEGHVTCLTTSNIFIREKDDWITPPLSDGVLAGITRHKIIEEKNVREEIINLDRLKSATEIFQSNSVIGLRPITLV